MEFDYAYITEAYHEYQNFIHLTCHDKLVDANLVTASYFGNNVFSLNVCIRRRNYSTGQLGVPLSGMEYFYFLNNKDPKDWTAVDLDAARAIMSAIKRFDTLDTQAQHNGFYESYILGYPIPVDAKPLNQVETEGDIANEVSPVMKSKNKEQSELESFVLEQKANGKNKEEIKKAILDKVFTVARKRYILRKTFNSQPEENHILKSWDLVGSASSTNSGARDVSRDDMKVRFRVP